MIKYYTYYNFGGYKDLYLGNMEDNDEYRYYLPLIGVYEERLKSSEDAELEAKVAKLKVLPSIVALSDKTPEYNYPDGVRQMISHSGYKVLYRHFDYGQMAISVRDIPGKKDIYGRSTLFTFIIVGETDEDASKINKIAEYVRLNVSYVTSMLSEKFEYDFAVNGLRFDLGGFNKEITKIINDEQIEELVCDPRRSVKLLIISPEENFKNTCNMQKFSKNDISEAYYTDGTKIEIKHHEIRIHHDRTHSSNWNPMFDIPDFYSEEENYEDDEYLNRLESLEKRLESIEERISKLEQIIFKNHE